MKKKLKKLLIEKGAVTSAVWRGLETKYDKSEESIEKIILSSEDVNEDIALPIISEVIAVPYVKLKNLKISEKVLKQIPVKVACHYKVLPLSEEESGIRVVTSDPSNINVIDDLQLMLKQEIIPAIAFEKTILEGIQRYYGVGAEAIEDMNIADKKEEKKIQKEDILVEDAAIIKFVDQIITEAVKQRATDIHIEPFKDDLRVRYRIDGILKETIIPPEIKKIQEAIISRIKIMANLNIAEKRIPQDGRIKLMINGEEYDLRISILPTNFGETVNIRILSNRMLLSLPELGLSPDNLSILEKIIKKPHGIAFLTGPTGSGKTTTLYACLSTMNRIEKKIISIEDPIEYQLDGITQMQINPLTGLTFATGLRAMLRHDPDIMMIGEVRDLETAQITIRVALTGHFVFSTIHTNDAAGGVSRLLDMGIEPYLLASSVECFIAQRLVRVICPLCKKELKPERSLLEGVGTEFSKSYKGEGCEECAFTGYRGRTAIYEFLLVTDAIRDAIISRSSASQIKAIALKEGMRTLRQDGWYKVKKGITTIDEVLRVTPEEG